MSFLHDVNCLTRVKIKNMICKDTKKRDMKRKKIKDWYVPSEVYYNKYWD